MKKPIRLLIITAFIIVCMFVLVGCDSTLNDAYQKAVEDGFVGTEAEWLASLTSGDSAYDIAVKNGFVGTEAEWIASLNGTDGIDGANGKNGVNGAQGLNGKDAKSPTLEEIYEAAVANEYKGDFFTFLNEYLDVNISNNTQVAANNAIRSAVSVYCTSTINYMGQAQDSTSAGSGVIFELDKENGNAFIITNYHVVYNAASTADNKIAHDIRVYLYGKEWGPDYGSSLNYAIPVEYVGGSMTYDIAVLKVSGSEVLKSSDSLAITVADSNHIPVGSLALAIGNPAAKGISVTSGIVSVDSETIGMKAVDNVTDVRFRVMRVDTAINNGNSGGGLFNGDGELIGIVNAKIASDEIENIGYAIPSNIAVSAAQNIIDNCDGVPFEKIKKPVLGVLVEIKASNSIYDVNTQKVRISQEITVSAIDEGGIADTTDLQVGDKLIKVLIRGVEYQLDRLYILSDLLLSCGQETIILTVERTVDDTTNTMEIEFSFTSENMSTIE